VATGPGVSAAILAELKSKEILRDFRVAKASGG